ncbi:MAG: thioredoxin domain-containing protein, partial [Methanobacteriota archaeon]
GARGDARANEVALATLEGMAAGGVRDHVGGGFHRYSVDEHWTVPHFEKMLYDNAGRLGNYVHAFQATGDGTWREVAEGVLRFVLGDLAVAGGGFGGSQDADVGAGDDGDFFTWTEEEMRAALSEEECRIARLHFGLGGRGRMHHDPARNVLHVSADLDSLAEGLHASQHDVRVLLRTILEKLRNARAKRKTPYVDRTRYASWNGMMAVALLRSGAALDRPDADRGALAALDAFLAHAFDPERGVAHVLAEDGTASGWGLLDDQAQFADALVEAYGATGDEKYRTAAVALGRLLADGFYDGTAFRDRIAPGDGEGLLTSVDHPVGDSPTPSPNATAIRALRRLTDATDDPRFGNVARQAATALSGECGRLGIYGSALALALDELDDPPAAVKLVGTVEATAPLRAAARKVFAPGLTIRTVGSERGVPAPAAIVCFGDRCLGPVSDPAALRAALEGRA